MLATRPHIKKMLLDIALFGEGEAANSGQRRVELPAAGGGQR